MTKEITCFIIMPFAKTTEVRTEDYWTEHYTDFLKPIIEEVGNISVTRSSPMRGDILKDIIKELIVTDIVVADLTDSNPNVYWELGLRQSFQHRTITIAEEGTKLPFDISNKGTHFYSSKNHLKSKKFSKELKLAIIDCIQNPYRPDSIILETITGRGTIQEITNKEQILRRLNAIISEYTYNHKILNDFIITMRGNKTVSIDQKSFDTERLRTACTELLITNRYIDSNDLFYKNCETYFDILNVINGQLMIWETHSDSTESFCLNEISRWRKIFRSFKTQIEKTQLQIKERK